jgi:hypothetical protein
VAFLTVVLSQDGINNLDALVEWLTCHKPFFVWPETFTLEQGLQ